MKKIFKSLESIQSNSKKFKALENLNLYIENNLKLVEYPNFARKRLPVYKFWYEVYYEEMRRNITDLNHSRRIIFDDLEPNSLLFCFLDNDKVVGSVRLSTMNDVRKSHYIDMLKDIFNNDYVFLTKLIVSKNYRNASLGKELIRIAENLVYKSNKRYLILDCNDYMIPYFENSGFQLLTNFAVTSPHYGNVYLMLKEI
ncbi:GNAT family N-acetyltransferase [Muribacter muris]|nr:GNAT family N-acetyltransferase [Muribacter muris]MBF0785345.1 GNAT family N-acetyltransferase [Muribacter muris]MBF0826000.1 GNAT family N-acetyltransferase [Muribacter muris]